MASSSHPPSSTKKRKPRPSAPSMPQLQKHLITQVPREIAEVLAPSIEWRCTATRITAVVPNLAWLDVFQRYAQQCMEQYALHYQRSLHVRCKLDAEEDSEQQQTNTLDSWLQDPGNEFALTACHRIINAPGIEHNPLYLYGPSGCGKTHLLHAVAHAYQSMLGDESVLFINGSTFVNKDAQELASRKQTPLRDALDNAVLICFDDIEHLASRNLAQEELFHIVNTCLENGQQLLFTGPQPHNHIHQLEERLSTRLGWGLSIGIDIPMLETRIAFLRQLAGSALDDIAEKDLPTLIETRAPDMRQVKKLADRLLNGEDLSIHQDDISFDRIVSCVSDFYTLRVGDIISKRRTRPITLARQTTLLLARRLTNHKLESLGSLVGGRDHTTIIYSLRQAEERIEHDSTYADTIRILTQTILG